jgi:hypothetical protein
LVLQKVTVTGNLLPGHTPADPAVMEAQRNALLLVFVQVAALTFGAKSTMVKKDAKRIMLKNRFMTASD